MPHGLVREKLVGGQIQFFLESLQDIHGVGEVIQAQHQHGQVVRLAGKLHGGFGNETQGALGTDEQMSQIVAGVVLGQILVQIQHIALTGDHFQAGNPVPAHAPANHLDAAGIGGQVATELARPGGGKIHRIVQTVFLGEGLQLLGHHPGLATHGAITGVEIQNLVHVVERYHHFAIGGHGACTQAGTSARRYQSHLIVIGKLHQRLHLLRGFRQDNGQRLGRVDFGPVLAVIVQIRRIGENLARVFRGGNQLFKGSDDLFGTHGCVSLFEVGPGPVQRSLTKN